LDKLGINVVMKFGKIGIFFSPLVSLGPAVAIDYLAHVGEGLRILEHQKGVASTMVGAIVRIRAQDTRGMT
jgi:hypothetical protein